MTDNLVSGLDLGEWLSLIGLALAIPPLVGFFFSLAASLKRASSRIALHEFVLLTCQLWLVALALVAVDTVAYLLILPSSRFSASLAFLISITVSLSLLASFFLAQSQRLSSVVIINEMRRLSKTTRDQRRGVCSAIRFDIDRLKAILNYSPALGERIRETVNGIIAEEVGRLRKQGRDVATLDIPGEDETVVIAAGLSVDDAGDFADGVRKRVKQEIKDIPYYAEVVELLTQRMQTPATLDEEREGIGTVSAGVAADRGWPEQLFSDVSAAVKESKNRGRNKTVIYRPGQPSEIRSDFPIRAQQPAP